MITLYIWDAQRIYSHSVETGPRGPMPANSTPTAPPETVGEQVAQWVGSGWVVLDERPAPEPAPEPDWPSLIADRRWQAEVAGIDVGRPRWRVSTLAACTSTPAATARR